MAVEKAGEQTEIEGVVSRAVPDMDVVGEGEKAKVEGAKNKVSNPLYLDRLIE